jgi:phytoene desaturase
VIGGMGALGKALATAAEKHGATLKLGTAVSAIDKTGDRVTGVTLASGETVSAKIVISSADPHHHFPRSAWISSDGSRYGEAG